MSTQVTLSNAIREGSKFRLQGFDDFFGKRSLEYTSCALGAAFEIIHGRYRGDPMDPYEADLVKIIKDAFPILSKPVPLHLIKKYNISVLSCVHTIENPPEGFSTIGFFAFITTLNDIFRLSREAIADIIENEVESKVPHLCTYAFPDSSYHEDESVTEGLEIKDE